MRIAMLAAAVSAVALASGAALAAPQPRMPHEIATVSMTHEVMRPTVTGSAASEPTIFGHPASQSTYMVSGRTLNVWGHEIDPGK